jgi:iron complex outermembrane recepter protein
VHSRPLSRSIASTLVALAVGSVLHAQEPAAAGDDIDEVVLTGSRISRNPNDTAPLPVSTISAQDIAAVGNVDATATLRQIPALVSSGTVADSIERGDGGIGQATLNLRQLGANRTLVLVDGYRHVSGVAGSQAVDVSTIPNALIERVDVLTGGASAVYGADAVTGVVNYVLKKNFEGAAFDAQVGMSHEGDGITKRFEGTFGRNFADGRGNLTLSAGFTQEAEVLIGQRSYLRNDQGANDNTTYGNPDKRFQKGEINPATMPNFAARYRLGGPGPRREDFPFGVLIPEPSAVAGLFPGGLTPAEQALVQRAANAPLYRIGRNPRFSIASKAGLVSRADFDDFSLDVNNNGQADCLDSFQGRFGLGGGSCYVTTPGGGVRVFQDGLIAGTQNQFGGDGSEGGTDNRTSVVPGSRRQYANLRGQFEFSPLATTFVDAKFAQNDTVYRNGYNTFYDGLLIFPDNPFIPAILQGEADDAGGLRVGRDFTDLGDNQLDASRSTLRVVAGLKGAFSDHFRYELVGNYGRTSIRETSQNSVLPDRLFAAIDVIADANGQPICRSDVDRTPHPGSQFFPESPAASSRSRRVMASAGRSACSTA